MNNESAFSLANSISAECVVVLILYAARIRNDVEKREIRLKNVASKPMFENFSQVSFLFTYNLVR